MKEPLSRRGFLGTMGAAFGAVTLGLTAQEADAKMTADDRPDYVEVTEHEGWTHVVMDHVPEDDPYQAVYGVQGQKVIEGDIVRAEGKPSPLFIVNYAAENHKMSDEQRDFISRNMDYMATLTGRQIVYLDVIALDKDRNAQFLSNSVTDLKKGGLVKPDAENPLLLPYGYMELDGQRLAEFSLVPYGNAKTKNLEERQKDVADAIMSVFETLETNENVIALVNE